MVQNGALDYPFIAIAKKMTGSFGDVSEFLTDISIVMRNMHLTANMVKSTCSKCRDMMLHVMMLVNQ